MHEKIYFVPEKCTNRWELVYWIINNKYPCLLSINVSFQLFPLIIYIIHELEKEEVEG